jgi:23S rRNA (cytosine1962-C5)-methyltransferase
MIDIVLKPGRDKSVRRRHPWVLSGSVASVTGPEQPGEWARVSAANGDVLAFGHYSPHSSLRVRLLSFGDQIPGDEFVAKRIAAAVERRRSNPMLSGTDAVRLVNSEGDGLPGLVVDRYRDVVVVKLVAAGMHKRRELIADALREATGAASGFERADSQAARREGVPSVQGALWGDAPKDPFEIDERGRRYRVDIVDGQKTGFYLDQRDSRDLVESLAAGRRVLDLFAYSGGFSVAASKGGASAVTLVESSASALELAKLNLSANGHDLATRFERGDVHKFLRHDDGHYDLVIVDPPPLARHKRDLTKATRAYKDSLLFALKRAAPGAFVLAFACSHTVSPDLFGKVVFGAALDAGLPLRILRTLGPPVDHPVSIDHPEGAYLTGLLLQV